MGILRGPLWGLCGCESHVKNVWGVGSVCGSHVGSFGGVCLGYFWSLCGLCGVLCGDPMYGLYVGSVLCLCVLFVCLVCVECVGSVWSQC